MNYVIGKIKFVKECNLRLYGIFYSLNLLKIVIIHNLCRLMLECKSLGSGRAKNETSKHRKSEGCWGYYSLNALNILVPNANIRNSLFGARLQDFSWFTPIYLIWKIIVVWNFQIYFMEEIRRNKIKKINNWSDKWVEPC